MVIMIDSGATHNFVSESMLKELGLIPEESGKYGVLTGGGITVKGKGLYRNVKIEMQRCRIITSLLPLSLGTADVVLGCQWLETRGETKCNWKLQRMKFMVGGEWVTIQGDPSLCNSAISLKALWKTVEDGGEGMIVEYCGMQKCDLESGEVPEGLVTLLTEYEGVFSEPQGLPPSRGKEHTITLAAGASPVSVRLFRYPQAQKTEIEKQVAMMLAA